MTRQAFTIAAIAFVCGTAAAAPLVTYESPCECRDYHDKGRLTEKNDAALPPTDPNAIQAVTPSDIFSWQGPTEPLTPSSRPIAAEQKWYAVTGRVVEVRAEADGDLHIALQDAFSWTYPKFPFRVRSGRKLKITEPPIITVTGKAFFDINHASARSIKPENRPSRLRMWEIHPVMKIAVNH